jgi:hypothetical protein
VDASFVTDTYRFPSSLNIDSVSAKGMSSKEKMTPKRLKRDTPSTRSSPSLLYPLVDPPSPAKSRLLAKGHINFPSPHLAGVMRSGNHSPDAATRGVVPLITLSRQLAFDDDKVPGRGARKPRERCLGEKVSRISDLAIVSPLSNYAIENPTTKTFNNVVSTLPVSNSAAFASHVQPAVDNTSTLSKTSSSQQASRLLLHSNSTHRLTALADERLRAGVTNMLEAPPLSFVHTNARFGAGLHEERSSLGQVEAQQFTRQLQPPPEGGLKSQLLTTRAFAMHRQHHQESAETENKRLRELIYGPYKKAVQFQDFLLSLRMTPAEYQLFKRIQQKHKALKLFEDKPPLLIKEEQAAEESTDSDGEDDYGVVTLKPQPAPVKPPTRPSTSGSISSSNDPLANLNPDTTNPHNNNGLDPNNKTAEGGSSSSNTAGGGSAQSMAGTSGETKSRPRTGMMQPAGVINTNSVDGEKGSADVAAAGDGTPGRLNFFFSLYYSKVIDTMCVTRER